MARSPRIEYEGAVYHVTARGNERRDIFRGDNDRTMFLSTLEDAIGLHRLEVSGYCLMPNHYHLLLATPYANLSKAMGWFQSTYTIRFNRKHRRSGHLFQGRFKAHLVDADHYAMELLRYVHLNPVRPKDKTSPIPIERWVQLQEHRWSSHPFYSGAAPSPEWLNLKWLNYFGEGGQSASKEYVRFLKQAFDSGVTSPWDKVGNGGVLGNEPFRAEVAVHLSEEGPRQNLIECLNLKREKVKSMAEGENIPWQIWLRVHHGGEKRIEVARSLGYKDGSAVTHILKRLDTQCKKEPLVAAHALSLAKKLEEIQVSRTDPASTY